MYPQSFVERRRAMMLAQRYIAAANRASFAARYGLQPGCLALRYAELLPDLLQRYDLDEAQTKADEAVFGMQDEFEMTGA